MMKNLLAIFILFAGLAAVQAAPRPNVLFIAVDDWNGRGRLAFTKTVW